MSSTQIERNEEDSKYLRQAEYYISTMLARFGGQDFTDAYYTTEDITKFLSTVFLINGNANNYRITKHVLDNVKFYKSIYVPVKDDEVLTEEEIEHIAEQLKRRNDRLIDRILCNAETVSRRITAEPIDDVKNSPIIKYATNILIKILLVLKSDQEVSPEGKDQIRRIFAILDGKEL